MPFYAHTLEGKPQFDWEPLFTPWPDRLGHQPSQHPQLDLQDHTDPNTTCTGQDAAPCPHCENLHPRHGHLNKVAHLAATFAAEMFPEGAIRKFLQIPKIHPFSNSYEYIHLVTQISNRHTKRDS